MTAPDKMDDARALADIANVQSLHDIDMSHTLAYLRTRLAAPASHDAQQAVRYVRWHPKHGYRWDDSHDSARDDEANTGWSSVPLYTHPHAQQQATPKGEGAVVEYVNSEGGRITPKEYAVLAAVGSVAHWRPLVYGDAAPVAAQGEGRWVCRGPFADPGSWTYAAQQGPVVDEVTDDMCRNAITAREHYIRENQNGFAIPAMRAALTAVLARATRGES